MKIVVGGQIDKEDIASIVRKELGDQAEVTVKGDLDATMGMKAGQYLQRGGDSGRGKKRKGSFWIHCAA